MINIFNSKGYVLLKMIIALGIIGFIFLASSSMLTTTINIHRKSSEQFRATVLAQSFFEEIKACSIKEIQDLEIDNGEFIVNIEKYKIDKYDGRLYKIIIEVMKDGETLEKIQGYKILDLQEYSCGESN